MLISLGKISAQSIVMQQLHASGVYHSGEQIRITASIKESIGDSVLIHLSKNFPVSRSNR